MRRMRTHVQVNGGAASAVGIGIGVGSQPRSLSVFVARHDLSGSVTIADRGCDADTDSDPDGLLS